jgi:hypothetical protein
MTNEPEVRWVSERLATLEPEWKPNLNRGRALLNAGTGRSRSGGVRTLVPVTAMLAFAFLAIPQTRTIAQEVWLSLPIHRVEVARFDVSRYPLESDTSSKGTVRPVATAKEAEADLGFTPYLPSAKVIAGTPRLAITQPFTVSQTIRTAQLKAALEKGGSRDVSVPSEWEGTKLQVAVQPILAASYPGDVDILQSKPMALTAPSGFPLERFAEVAFRTVGLGWWESRIMARKFAAQPAWLLAVPEDEVVSIQEHKLAKGTGVLIEDFGENGQSERTAIVYSTRDRIYIVSGPNREEALRIANSLP